MPIAFACACGKSFQVPDDRAGRKTKCPACAAPLTVPPPAAEADFEVVDDDEPAADFEVVDDDEPVAAAKPVKKAKAAVVEDDEPKKKKKKSTRVDTGDWRAEEEARMYAAYKFKRLVYICAGAGTVVISGIALGIFALNGMLGIIPVGACGCGVLGGMYCIWQGISGTFHER